MCALLGRAKRNSVGALGVPVFRWKTLSDWKIGNTGDIVDYTGLSGAAAVIVLKGGIGGGVGSPDFLVLPLGNVGQTVCTKLDEVAVVNIPERSVNVNERVVDVDVYWPYAG